jgi:SAM-dependent methyltransferase
VIQLINLAKKQVRRSRLGHGWVGVKTVGPRDYVGGLWDEIGRLQFDFLIKHGLQPSDVVIDIGCGSLRAGVHLIPYLEPGHYLGIEKEWELIRVGLKHELAKDIRAKKHPEFLVFNSFEFDNFSRRPTVGIAHSLFTHLPEHEIRDCLSKARGFFMPGGRLFATYFEGSGTENPSRPHDHQNFYYTSEQMVEFGEATGWQVRYIGDWSHPRGQVMVEYTAS